MSTAERSLNLLKVLNARRRVFGRVHPRTIQQSLDVDQWDRDHGWQRNLAASDDVRVWDGKRWVRSEAA